jgi:hypothetical protein
MYWRIRKAYNEAIYVLSFLHFHKKEIIWRLEAIMLSHKKHAAPVPR